MKNITNLFFIVLMTSITSLYPYCDWEFKGRVNEIYKKTYPLAFSCNCMNTAEGKKLFTAMRTLFDDIKADVKENGSTSWPQEEIWMTLLFEKQDKEGHSLEKIASSSSAPLCRHIREELKKMKEEAKNNSK